MTTARRLVRRTAEAALLVLAVAAASAAAQPRGRVLDGSSPAKLETSVALLQNDLAGRRREELDIALAIIWMNRTASSGDVNGDLDAHDVERWEADATDLLTEIQRGNLVSTIEAREEADGDYKAADYFAQLHGLGFDEIVSLAGRPTVRGYLAAVRQAGEQLACQSDVPAIAHPSESRVLRRRNDFCGPRGIEPLNGRAFAAAATAMREGRPAEAKATLDALRRGRLSPYERSMVEQLLFSVAETEGNLVAAREHLLNALAARGLTPAETTEVLARIRDLDARLPVQAQ